MAVIVTPSLTSVADIAVNDGDITSTATTFNLLNSVVTTLNIGGAATTIAIGAAGVGSKTTINSAQILAGNGTAALPVCSFASDPDTGAWIAPASGNGIAFSVDSIAQFRISNNGVNLSSTGSFRWSSDLNVFEGGGSDVFLYRDAANTLALRNGVNAQVFRSYNTFTDASNYERLNIGWATNVATITTAAAGTGTLRGLNIGGAITDLVGLYGVTPIAQRAGAAQAAVATTGSTQTTPFGFTTAAQADAIVTLVNELRAWAVAFGAIKGAA